MEEEIKKSKKIENIMSILLAFFCLLFVFVVVFVIANRDNLQKEENVLVDETTYVRIEALDVSNYLNIYKSANLKKVNFLNIPSNLVSNFYTKQDEFIDTLNSNVTENKQYIEQYNTDNSIADYTANSVVDSIILCQFKDNILSLLYLVEEDIDYVGLNNYITNIFIDVNNNSLVNGDNIISKYNLNKENIVLEVFNNVINYHEDKFIDKDTNEEKTLEEVKSNQEGYIKTLNDSFDDYIYLYFNQDNLYLKYNRSDISNLLFNENLETVKYSTLKLEI